MDQPPPYPAAAPGQPYPPPGAYPPAGAVPPGGPMDSKAMPPQGQPGAQVRQNNVFVPNQAVQCQVNNPYPTQITCPSCNASVITETTYTNGGMAWLLAGGMCLAGLWLGCCFIPFCVKRFKDVTHHCPNCNAIVGFHKRI